MDEIGCAECGLRYDSDENAFCPRCGSQAKAPERGPTMRAAARTGKGRRRVQAGGVILIVLGALALLQSIGTLVAPPDADDASLEVLADVEMFRDLPGGRLMIAAPNATYTLSALGETNATVQVAGNESIALEYAFMNLTVMIDGENYYRHLYVPEGDALRVSVQPGDETFAWASDGAGGAVRGIAGFVAFFAALVVLGGVMALRVKQRRLAIVAAVIALLPGIFILVFVPLAGLLLLIVPGVAAALIIAGRREFD